MDTRVATPVKLSVRCLRGGSNTGRRSGRRRVYQAATEKDRSLMKQIENEERTISLVPTLPDAYDETTGRPIYERIPTCWPIFVDNMEDITSDLDLLTLFEPYGEVLEIYIFNDKETGESLCKAIVWFLEKRARDTAVECNKKVLGGTRIRVRLPSAQAWKSIITANPEDELEDSTRGQRLKLGKA
ncbi:hypothetical protein AAMO2058_000418400 [Amorphochlora amoebiformis]